MNCRTLGKRMPPWIKAEDLEPRTTSLLLKYVLHCQLTVDTCLSEYQNDGICGPKIKVERRSLSRLVAPQERDDYPDSTCHGQYKADVWIKQTVHQGADHIGPRCDS